MVTSIVSVLVQGDGLGISHVLWNTTFTPKLAKLAVWRLQKGGLALPYHVWVNAIIPRGS